MLKCKNIQFFVFLDTGETRRIWILCKSYNFVDYGSQILKTPNSKAQKIGILHEINF